MELGAVEIQIFVSLVVVLGAAFVALICDFLKGNNEQLRERNIELRVRREEQDLRYRDALRRWRRRPVTTNGKRPQGAHSRPAAQPAAAAETVPGAPLWASENELKQVELMAESIRIRVEREFRGKEPAQAVREVTAEKEPVPLVLAGAVQQLPAPAASVESGRFDQLTRVAEPLPSPLRPKVTAINTIAAEREEPLKSLDISEELSRVARTLTVEEPEETLAEQPQASDAGTWEERVPQNGVPAPAVDGISAAQQTASPETPASEPEVVLEVEMPAGFHEPSVLEELMRSSQPFRGIAVSVTINDMEGVREKVGPKGAEELMTSIAGLITSQLQAQDFACQPGEDEFLLICPKETGASAQRRLQQVSQRLWDFQLRSLGTLSILFSWGAVEAHGDTLADAVAAARERMCQTKRTRRTSASALLSSPRVAVNS